MVKVALKVPFLLRLFQNTLKAFIHLFNASYRAYYCETGAALGIGDTEGVMWKEEDKHE